MLSPLDLKNRKVEVKKRKYYDKDEMDEYLELVFDQYKELYNENQELKKNVKTLSDGVQYYRSLETTMQKALVLAEKTAAETKNAAQLKAEAIEKDANKKAEKIVSEAEHVYDKLKEKCLYLVQQFNQYKIQLKQVASAQLELITSDSFDVCSPELEAIQEEKTRLPEMEMEMKATKVEVPKMEELQIKEPKVQKTSMLEPEEMKANDLDKTMVLPDVKEIVSEKKKRPVEEDVDILTADTIDLSSSIDKIREQTKAADEAVAQEPVAAEPKAVQDALVLEPVDAVVKEPMDLQPIEAESEQDVVLEPKPEKTKETTTLDSLLQSINLGKKNKKKKGQDEDPFEFLGSVDDF